MMQGKSGLAYTGVNALQPPDVSYSDRAPTTNDYIGYGLMHLWHVVTGSPHTYQLWYLADKSAGIATWLQLYPNTAGGGGNLRSEDLLISIPTLLGYINVYGTEGEDWDAASPNQNITTYRIDANTLGVGLTKTISQPNTNITATQGMYKLGGSDFMHNYGTNNTALGHGTLNLTLQPAAQDNTAIGHGALNSVDLSFGCTACGSGALTSLEDGQYVTALGFEAGKNLSGADSDCIMIASPGILGDLNCIRIGQGGIGAGQQDKLFIPAVWEGVAEPGVDTGLTIVNANGKMYVDVIDPNSVLMTDATGNPIGVKGAAGTVLTGHGIGLADPAPEFLPITSPDLSVTIGVDPVTGSITLVAAPAGGGVSQFTTDDTLNVFPDPAHNINVFGRVGDVISTTGAIANTITLQLNDGDNGYVLAGNGVGTPSSYKQLTSDGSIVFDLVSDPTKINMIAVGGGGSGITNLLGDSGAPATPILGAVTIKGGKNIYTVSAAGEVEVNVTDNVDLLGWLHAALEVQTATNLISTGGNLIIPNTDATGTMGAIRFGAGAGTRWIHNYGTSNVFHGPRAGNNTLTTAQYNVGMGLANLESLTTGKYNSSYGNASSADITSGSSNSAFGRNSLYRLKTGNRNQAFGAGSGENYTGSESDNLLFGNKGEATDIHVIRIGTDGSGDYEQFSCYIAGIRNASAGASPMMVVIGSDHKLSAQTIPSGAASTFNANSGSATPAAGVLDILGRYNVTTAAAGNNVLIDLDPSIQQGNTTSGGAGIYALGTRGANTYTTNRFMHNYGTSSSYLGWQAGPISGAGGVGCTGLGYQALMNVAGGTNQVAVGNKTLDAATTSSRCTALGYAAGTNVTTGNNNVLVGFAAGNVYTTENYNIILGGSDTSSVSDASDVGDSRVMRLGFYTQWSVPTPTPHDPDPGETKTATGTDSTYIYGIYRSTVDASGTPVYVDRTGKLGTEGGAMFAVRQTTTLTNVTGDGTFYKFGTSGGLTIDFDNTSSLSGGSSSTLIFTAPYYGKYCFVATVTYSIPKVVAPVRVEPIYVVTSNISYVYTNYLPAGSTATIQYVSEIVHCIVYLDAGDTVWFGCYAGHSSAAKNLSIPAYLTLPVSPYSYCYGTHFEGYRIS